MSDYKNRVIGQLQDAERRRNERLDVCFDLTASVEERVTAFGNVGSLTEEGHFRQAMALVDDDTADERLRAVALEKSAQRIGADEQLIDRVIDMMNDSALPARLRRAAVRVVQVSSFASPIFPAMRPAYMGALRTLIDDEDRSLSDTAVEYLALSKDEYVQRRLIEGLEDPDREITEPEKAVQYLSYDLHADHFPILRRLVQHPPNEQTRREALRNLGADSDSVGLLQAHLDNREEAPEVRHLCAVALQNLDQPGFQAKANEIIEDDAEDDELKVALVNTLLHTLGHDRAPLKTGLRRVMEISADDGTRSRAKKLLNLVEPESDQ